MQDQLILFVAFIVGFIPTYGFLLFLTRGKIFPEKIEKDIFLSYVIGAAVGVGVSLLRIASINSVSLGSEEGLSAAVLIISPFLAALDVMPVVLFLNRKRFIGKPQAIYASVSFALGMGAMEITMRSYRLLTFQGFYSSYEGALALSLFIPGLLLLPSALGFTIGVNRAMIDPLKKLIGAYAVMTIYNFLAGLYQVLWNLWPLTFLILILGFWYLTRSAKRLRFNRKKIRKLEKDYFME